MRKTDLRLVTTGVVIVVVFAVFLLGFLRARVVQELSPGRVPDGATLFVEKGCANCHYIDKKAFKAGPGLKGLFARNLLPVSNMPVNEDNVRRQLETPYRNMPSFSERLTEEEKNRILSYLKTL